MDTPPSKRAREGESLASKALQTLANTATEAASNHARSEHTPGAGSQLSPAAVLARSALAAEALHKSQAQAAAWYEASPTAPSRAVSRRPPQGHRNSTVLYSEEDLDFRTPHSAPHTTAASFNFNYASAPAFKPASLVLMSPNSERNTARSQGLPASPPMQTMYSPQAPMPHSAPLPFLMPPTSNNIYMMTSPLQSPGAFSTSITSPVGMPSIVNPHVLPQTAAINDAELMSAIAKKPRHRAVKVDDDTVAWLKSNFEIKPGCHVARNLVYKAYVAHMQSMMLEPCNAAGFGKTIRTVFKSVTSRRLGSRGNSRYHYDGLRIKPSSAVAMMKLVDDDEPLDDSPAPSEQSQRLLPALSTAGNVTQSSPTSSSAAANTPTAVPKTLSGMADVYHHLAMLTDKQLLLPAFPPLLLAELSEETQQLPNCNQLVDRFNTSYRTYAEEVLNMVRRIRFSMVYSAIHELWKSADVASCAALYVDAAALDKIQLWDTILYDTMLHVLAPEVLRPIGASMHHAISNFAADLMSSVTALAESDVLALPEAVVTVKKLAADIFVNIVQRRLSLNNLAQAASKMLQSETQRQQMRQDLRRVDLQAVRYDGLWVTGCPEVFVEKLLDELQEFFGSSETGLTALSQWLDRSVNSVFEEALQRIHTADDGESEAGPATNARAHEAASSAAAAASTASEAQLAMQERSLRIIHETARDFLRNWTYYSSQIMRELTVKSAPSFGSFNVLRLLMDEYVHYLVQTRVTHPQKKIIHPEPKRRDQRDAAALQSLHDDPESYQAVGSNPVLVGQLSPHGMQSTSSSSGEWSAPSTSSPKQPGGAGKIDLPRRADDDDDDAMAAAAAAAVVAAVTAASAGQQ